MVVNVLKYSNQTKKVLYILYKIIGKLVGYTDSDFARNLLNSKSILASGPITWMSKTTRSIECKLINIKHIKSCIIKK